MQTAVSVGATLLGAFMGHKTMSASTIGRASTAIGRAGRSMEQASDIGRAQETVAEYQRQLDDLNAQCKEETNALEAKIDPAGEALEPVGIMPKKPTTWSNWCLWCGHLIVLTLRGASHQPGKTNCLTSGCACHLTKSQPSFSSGRFGNGS